MSSPLLSPRSAHVIFSHLSVSPGAVVLFVQLFSLILSSHHIIIPNLFILVLMLNFSDFPSNLFPQLDATAAFFFADFRSSSRKLASYPLAIFQNAFRRRLPSKSES